MFERYQKIKYHGFFLFPNGSDIHHNIYFKYWEDVNHLTANYIDIYFTKEDVKGKSGFETLYTLDSIKHLSDEIVLPCLIIWDVELGMKKSIAISLANLIEDQILAVLQMVVTAIRKKKDLIQIGSFVKSKINTDPAYRSRSMSVTYIEKQEASNIYNVENLNA